MEKIEDLTKKNKSDFMTLSNQSVKIYIDKETGEELSVCVSIATTKDNNFHKVWLEDYAKIMAELGGAKITVFSHIVKNINPISNEFGGTNREIAEDTGVSLSIVNQTIQDLIRMGFMNKKRVACYVINPNILLKGTHGKRMGLLRIYQSNE